MPLLTRSRLSILGKISYFCDEIKHLRSNERRKPLHYMALQNFTMTRNLVWVLFFALVTFSSCTTDFELEAPWKDIPVVYGFLNAQDSAHYIRVEKAFLEPGGNANAIAQNVDSLYYDPSTVTVQLQKVNTGQRFTLQRVDGNLEGYVRQSGPFANAPNYLYKIKSSAINLTAEQRIRLLINRGNGLPAVTAETTVLGPLSPRPTAPGNPLNLDYTRQLVFVWDVPPSAALFDLRMRIHYREIDPALPGGSANRTLEWEIQKDLEKSDLNAGFIRYDDLKGEDFYRFVGAALEANPNKQRVFQSIDLIYTAAGTELADLIRVEQANTGITSSQAIPVYTNLSEGRGVFSSRTGASRTGLTLNAPSLDSLRNGVYTRALNFQ